MTGVLEGLVIASPEPVDHPTAVLNNGWRFLPITIALGDAIGRTPIDDPRFLELTSEVAALATHLSMASPVAYLHLEFHGGTGLHAAIVWDRGEVVFGPLFTVNHPAERPADDYVVLAGRRRIRDMAISAALRSMGVRVVGGVDELAAVGLDRFRWTEEWLA